MTVLTFVIPAKAGILEIENFLRLTIDKSVHNQ